MQAPPIPPHMQTVEPKQRSSARSSLGFSVAFATAVLVALALSLWLASLTSLSKQTDSAAGYGHRAAGAACDVLIYGDSTALYGVNPLVIQRRTGLKACNIAEARPTEDFVGPHFPIDDYLARNPPPKVLLTTWSTADFQLDRTPKFSNNPDGFDYAIRYDRGPWLWREMLLHPADSLSLMAFETRVFLAAIRRTLDFSKRESVGIRAVRDRQLGWLDRGGPGQTACVGVPKSDVPAALESNRKGVQVFRSRYEALGLKVIINASPAANCVPNLQQNLTSIQGLYDNRFEALPVSSFVDRDVHLFGQSAAHYSEEVADQILVTMNEDQKGTQ